MAWSPPEGGDRMSRETLLARCPGEIWERVELQPMKPVVVRDGEIHSTLAERDDPFAGRDPNNGLAKA